MIFVAIYVIFLSRHLEVSSLRCLTLTRAEAACLSLSQLLNFTPLDDCLMHAFVLIMACHCCLQGVLSLYLQNVLRREPNELVTLLIRELVNGCCSIASLAIMHCVAHQLKDAAFTDFSLPFRNSSYLLQFTLFLHCSAISNKERRR